MHPVELSKKNIIIEARSEIFGPLIKKNLSY